MNIILYHKTGCPWASAVMQFLNDHNLPFEARDIILNEQFAREVETKSGQSKSPTLDIDGTIIPDADVEDVARHLETLGVNV